MSDTNENKIESSLEDCQEMVTAVKNHIGVTKRSQEFEFVKKTSMMSWKVEKRLEKVIEAATDADKIPLTHTDFVAWSLAARGRNDARGKEILRNKLVSMLYLAYCTAIALEHLPDFIRDKCAALEDEAERLRNGDDRDDEEDEEEEDEAAEDEADKLDALHEEYEPYAEECEFCFTPAEDLRQALEDGNLTAAIEAISNGDLFLDIGLIEVSV